LPQLSSIISISVPSLHDSISKATKYKSSCFPVTFRITMLWKIQINLRQMWRLPGGMSGTPTLRLIDHIRLSPWFQPQISKDINRNPFWASATIKTILLSTFAAKYTIKIHGDTEKVSATCKQSMNLTLKRDLRPQQRRFVNQMQLHFAAATSILVRRIVRFPFFLQEA
jgi:hypothetical protein